MGSALRAVVCLALPLVAPGAAAVASAGSGDADTVVIGISSPATGEFASEGNPLENGVKFAVDEINTAGGFTVGDVHYQLEAVAVDDEGQQAGAVQAATQLIDDEHAIAIFGPIGPLAPATAEVARDQNVLLFSSSSALTAIAGPPDYPNAFSTIAAASARIAATVDSVTEFVPDAHTVAVLAPDDETSAALVAPLEERFAAAGLEVTDYLYPTGTTDLSTVLTRIEADDPDLIFSGWSVPDQAAQAQQFAAAGISDDTTLFLYAGSIDNCLTGSGGRPCIAHPLAGSDLSAPGITGVAKQFVDDYLAWSGRDALPERSAPLLWTYDFVYLLVDAMQSAGTVDDATAIGDALRSGVTRDGLLGAVSFGPDNVPVFGFDVSYVEPDGTVTTEHFG